MDKNIERLMEFVKDNPGLRVIYMVDSDVVQDDCGEYWMGKNIKVDIDYYIDDDVHGLALIRSYYDDCDIYKLFYGNTDCTDEHIKEEIDKLPWEKVIIVWIGPNGED